MITSSTIFSWKFWFVESLEIYTKIIKLNVRERKTCCLVKLHISQFWITFIGVPIHFLTHYDDKICKLRMIKIRNFWQNFAFEQLEHNREANHLPGWTEVIWRRLPLSRINVMPSVWVYPATCIPLISKMISPGDNDPDRKLTSKILKYYTDVQFNICQVKLIYGK